MSPKPLLAYDSNSFRVRRSVPSVCSTLQDSAPTQTNRAITTSTYAHSGVECPINDYPHLHYSIIPFAEKLPKPPANVYEPTLEQLLHHKGRNHQSIKEAQILNQPDNSFTTLLCNRLFEEHFEYHGGLMNPK